MVIALPRENLLRPLPQRRPRRPDCRTSGYRTKVISSSAKPAGSAVEAKAAPPAAQEQEEEDHARSSPPGRKIARENNINLSQVAGTGLGGRITKQDITAFL